jgi:hypothetical protein
VKVSGGELGAGFKNRVREEFADARRRVGRNSIPRLIELLESADLRTRFLAEMCLRDAAGT